jgi:hypothetical protein
MAHYTGPILMEVMMTHSRFQAPEDFLRRTQAAARKTWEAIRGCERIDQTVNRAND